MGFIVGVLARFVYPGAVPLGFWMTALLGIGGSIVVGYTNPDNTSGAQPVGGGYQFNTLTREMSPIAPGAMSQFNMILDNMGSVTASSAGPNVPPLGLAVDQTVYFVSPTSP